MTNITERINESLAQIRPSLQADGGDIELVNFDESTGVVELRFVGMCVGCPMAQYTLNEGVAAQLKADVPEVKEVLSV